MLSFWILFLFLIPTLLNQIATTKYGIPSRELATVKAREKNSSIDREALLKKYIEQNPHHDPEKYKNASMKTIQWYPDFLAWQMEVEKGQERLEENFHKELIRQQQFIERYSFISPGIIVSQVYNDITETGVTNYVSYARDLRTFSHSYKDFLRDKIFRREPLTLSELKQLPAFIPAEVSHYKSILFKNITIISLLLIILTVAAFMQTGKNSIV
jgi:ABC-2 type transport system permease protein